MRAAARWRRSCSSYWPEQIVYPKTNVCANKHRAAASMLATLLCRSELPYTFALVLLVRLSRPVTSLPKLRPEIPITEYLAVLASLTSYPVWSVRSTIQHLHINSTASEYACRQFFRVTQCKCAPSEMALHYTAMINRLIHSSY